MAAARKRRTVAAKLPDPTEPATWEPEDVHAIKAVMQGRASEAQQVRAMEYILHKLCRVDESGYFSGGDGDRKTAYAQGKRFVGVQLRSFYFQHVSSPSGAPREQGT